MQRPPSTIFGAAAVAAALLLASADRAEAVLIDSFDTTFQTVQTRTSAGSSVLASEAIGGERDLYVEVLIPPASDVAEVELTVDPSSGLAAYSEPFAADGFFQITWDGIDGDPINVNTDGLGGIDLGSAGIRLFANSELEADASFEIWSESGKSSLTREIAGTPGTSTLVEYEFPFADFDVDSGSGANFASVGAIRLTIDGQFSRTDLAIDLIETEVGGGVGGVIPEPSSMALLGIGLMGMVGYGARRRKKTPTA